MKTVIMAGGKGTRISSIASEIPKPMIKIAGKPVLEHAIESLSRQGYRDVIITVGHLANTIIDYFEDGKKYSPATGLPFDVDIEYFVEDEPMGNAGALFHLRDRLSEDFLLINADSIFDIDLDRFVDFHRQNSGLATIFTHPNSHPYDSGLIVANNDHTVQKWLTKEDVRPIHYKNRVNAGLHVLSNELLKLKIDMQKIDLDRQILQPLAGTGQLYCYNSSEYVRDMGTPERYHAVTADVLTGLVQKRNLSNRQKAIFLDRDGTINKYVGFLRDIDDFELIDGVSEAIQKINSTEFLAIVATNQPVIARGEVTIGELEEIHNKMETLLGNKGAYLDAIYYCPHHPDKGYLGEIEHLKFDCNCRKPKTGMLSEAEDNYNVNLSESWMVGDSQNDIEAGKNAGCMTALITEGYEDYGQTVTVRSLNQFVEEYII